jgi:hypothetical protein
VPLAWIAPTASALARVATASALARVATASALARVATASALARVATALVLVAAGLSLSPTTVAFANRPNPTPYTDPLFGASCAWHVFDEGERPPWWLYLEDPLCVEYAKRDITLDNGGWLRFLLAEPARFAIAVPSCRYWQRDHWSVQVSAGAPPLVGWDGSYWFDKRLGVLAARLTGFRVSGVTVGVGDAVLALRPHFPDLADALAAYGSAAGESGLAVSIPSSLC